ncbi:caspase-3-like isoform X3 [Tubulanus polymorphus]|uniref:caspase-3-like isoform X3 n=1 Tax=Tubulanus polymorphus TaxID=672921 RepID=UPI003DA36220
MEQSDAGENRYKYNDVWMLLNDQITNDDFEKLKDSFRAESGAESGLTEKEIDKCGNVFKLRGNLVKKGIVSKANNEVLIEHLNKCGLAGHAESVIDYQKQVELNEKQVPNSSTSSSSSIINSTTKTAGQKRNKSFEVPSSESFEAKRSKSSNSGETISDCRRHRTHVCYKRTRSKPGLVLIINQFTQDRLGTEKDEDDIKQLFKNELNFDVIVTRDLSKVDADRMIEEVKSKLKTGLHDSFVLFILSHGDKEGIKTVGSDGHEEPDVRLKIDELHKQLNSSSLPEMSGKPKVILVQACRGEQEMSGNIESDDKCKTKESRTNEETQNQKQFIPKEADFLTAYSQTNEYLSYRNTCEGSWFIQEFLDVLNDNKHCHVLDILTMVNSNIADRQTRIKRYKQMPVFVSSLRKFFYFVESTL